MNVVTPSVSPGDYLISLSNMVAKQFLPASLYNTVTSIVPGVVKFLLPASEVEALLAGNSEVSQTIRTQTGATFKITVSPTKNAAVYELVKKSASAKRDKAEDDIVYTTDLFSLEGEDITPPGNNSGDNGEDSILSGIISVQSMPEAPQNASAQAGVKDLLLSMTDLAASVFLPGAAGKAVSSLLPSVLDFLVPSSIGYATAATASPRIKQRITTQEGTTFEIDVTNVIDQALQAAQGDDNGSQVVYLPIKTETTKQAGGNKLGGGFSFLNGIIGVQW